MKVLYICTLDVGLSNKILRNIKRDCFMFVCLYIHHSTHKENKIIKWIWFLLIILSHTHTHSISFASSTHLVSSQQPPTHDFALISSSFSWRYNINFNIKNYSKFPCETHNNREFSSYKFRAWRRVRTRYKLICVTFSQNTKKKETFHARIFHSPSELN